MARRAIFYPISRMRKQVYIIIALFLLVLLCIRRSEGFENPLSGCENPLWCDPGSVRKPASVQKLASVRK
jgi:hypothetical protein